MYMYNNIYCNVTTQSRERKKINAIIHVDTYKYINTIMAYDHGNMKTDKTDKTDKKVNVRTQILKRVKLVRYGLLSSIYYMRNIFFYYMSTSYGGFPFYILFATRY
jgi:hypothetical protein